MKLINAILFISIYSFDVNAAFTEPEISQLAEINKKIDRKNRKGEKEKRRKGEKNSEDTINKTIKNLPEEKFKIIDLKKSWSETIKKV